MKIFNLALLWYIPIISGLLLQIPYGCNESLEFKASSSVPENETSKNSIPKPLTAAQMKAGREKWEATPAGIKFKEWEASPAGKKVYAAEAKIRSHINAFTNMEAVVTSLSLPQGSRLGFGVMARINGVDYIVTFDAEKSQLELLHSLKVNDKLILRSHTVSHAPKYSHPIISCEYGERDSKVIFKRVPRKNGC